MKIMKNKLFQFAILAGLLIGCTDIVQVDISNSSVTIVSPTDNIVSSNFNQLFKWEELKGAENYELQIVRPDFGNIQEFVLDSTTAETQFSVILQPGTYQWRLRAKNNISNSLYSTRTITIDSTLDLSGQPVILISPIDNYSTSVLANTFSWQTMPNATDYIFQILSSGTVIETQPIPAPATTTVTTTYTFGAEGNYQWRVIAQNSSSSSSFNLYDISIDQTNPTAPVLALPIANDSSTNPVSLTWISDLSSVADSVMIYADTNLVTLVDAQLISTQTYSFIGIVNQDYFWRVRSKDAAGNWGPFATRRKFIIKP